ncbi:uncharacterized protein J3R85_019516 [Psidium guajava]|nr:uncharacterized protein J3R85_019516 [Psidium guajava]
MPKKDPAGGAEADSTDVVAGDGGADEALGVTDEGGEEVRQGEARVPRHGRSLGSFDHKSKHVHESGRVVTSALQLQKGQEQKAPEDQH